MLYDNDRKIVMNRCGRPWDCIAFNKADANENAWDLWIQVNYVPLAGISHFLSLAFSFFFVEWKS